MIGYFCVGLVILAGSLVQVGNDHAWIDSVDSDAFVGQLLRI